MPGDAGSQPPLFQQAMLAQAQVEFLAGFIARTAFGEKPTAAQQRMARDVAETFAVQIAALRFV